MLAALAGAPSEFAVIPIRGLFLVGGPDLPISWLVRASRPAPVASLTALRPARSTSIIAVAQDWTAGFGLDDAGGRADQVRVAQLPGREDRLVLGVAVVVVGDQGAGVPLEQAEQVQGAVPAGMPGAQPPGAQSAG